ncbi:peptidoglycan DD-metalloendopeptidase family protein [Tenacibaculum sp. ZS6-P6]|uniref:peptidoglycan DD-metalloendopeptidase family protein n=1 Tax=Tenacibaculum sp. ZS6-P6 TaxID=3447503 RepID=UPI003F948D2D
MSNYLIFLVKSSLIFIVFYLAYVSLFRKHTFFQLNRLILILFIPVSIILSSIDVFSPLEISSINIPKFIEIDQMMSENFSENQILKEKFNYSFIITLLYFFGVIISLFSLIKSVQQLIKLKKESQLKKSRKYTFIYANITEVFSCFNWIFIPKSKRENIDNLIIEHEKKHVDFKHTLDLLITELYIILFWFNPFVYYFRKSLKSVHEFQVDKEVLLTNKINISDYLKVLRKEINSKTNIKLYSYFKQPIIKKRLEMISKNKTNSFKKIKYLILIPIISICLLSFNQDDFNNNLPVIITDNNSIPSIFPIQNKTVSDITSHFGKLRKFGKKSEAKIHQGIDIRAAIGTPIVATADGIISYASYKGNWGNLIVVTHTNGYETWYAHLNSFKLKKGKSVKKGEVIGFTGDTGLSKGPHLHYEVKHNSKNVNPLDYIK